MHHVGSHSNQEPKQNSFRVFSKASHQPQRSYVIITKFDVNIGEFSIILEVFHTTPHSNLRQNYCKDRRYSENSRPNLLGFDLIGIIEHE